MGRSKVRKTQRSLKYEAQMHMENSHKNAWMKNEIAAEFARDLVEQKARSTKPAKKN
jgi:hypothetical protein